ncbi:LuxR C-terminal-related transcriptional regulator [Streptomyces malaysiensis]|uniref:LuxR C-terminal-related transcriptional regulator n=1 Tax=Streptomyces malaysiensis TaxID=92644 RepID=UPI003D7C30C3
MPVHRYVSKRERVVVTSQPSGRWRLSAREREALQLIASGMTPAQAAAEMGVGTSRVNDCLRFALVKLGSPERPGAVHWAYTLGEISPPEHTNDGADLVLSGGQHEVLRGLAGGQDLRWIAANGRVHLDVVRRDVRALMALVGAKTPAHLIRRGWELGVLGPAPDKAPVARLSGAQGVPSI